MKVRRATPGDLPTLLAFTAGEYREAEASAHIPGTLEEGVRCALEDPALAMYWLLLGDDGEPVGSVSAVQEWSDWGAGFYWWIQSMYLLPAYRGKGLMALLLEAVKTEMRAAGGLELRLYVHEDNLRAKNAYLKANFRKSPYEIMVLEEEE